MIRFLRRLRGFTLLEVLLVLVVIAVIAVAAIRYLKHQQEVAADQVYGLKLYTYGQAVNAYISSARNLQNNCQLPGPNGNPSVTLTNCSSGGIGTATLTVTGVSWLYPSNAGTAPTGNPFLPPDFTFGDLAPLQMASVNPDGSMGSAIGDKAIVTTVTFAQSLNPPPPPPTITIQTGGLFEIQGGVDSHGKPIPPVFMPALTQDAISHANTLYSASLGPAAVTYTFPYLQAGGATPKPGNVTGAVSLTGTPYLEVQGSNAGGNSMMGTINFDSSAGANAAVTGVNQMTFTPVNGQASAMSSLDQFSFSANGGTITNLRTLNFAGGQIGGIMTGVQKINFDLNNAVPNNRITGVSGINFRYGQTTPFQGLTVSSGSASCVHSRGWNGHSCDTGIPATVNGSPSSICFVGEVEGQVLSGCNGKPPGSGNTGCAVVISQATGNWSVVNSGTGDSGCTATCLIWSH